MSLDRVPVRSLFRQWACATSQATMTGLSPAHGLAQRTATGSGPHLTCGAIPATGSPASSGSGLSPTHVQDSLESSVATDSDMNATSNTPQATRSRTRLDVQSDSSASGCSAAGPPASASTQQTTHPSQPQPVATSHVMTRLQKGIINSKVRTDGTVPYGMPCIAGEPTNLETALSDPRWKNAMDEEYMALMRNKTWHLVPKQRGKNIIDCKVGLQN